MQRQELETRIFEGDFENTFAASRDAFQNAGFAVETSDFQGGVLVVGQERRRHNPTTALTLSILLPPAGDFYMQRYAWGILDLLLWPFSIAWAAPSNYHLARTRYRQIGGTVAIQELKPQKTRVRVSLSGVDWDAEKYPVQIRQLQEEINRQLFLRYGDSAQPPIGATIPGESPEEAE